MKRKTRQGESSPAAAQPEIPRRMRVSLLRCLILACMIASAAARGFAQTAMTLDLSLNGLRQAQPPHLVGDVLILSYRPASAADVRFVGARFATENYALLHVFSKNQYGVYVLDYEVPENTLVMRYRMVVDGLWVNDPSNPEIEADGQGNLISLFTIEKEPQRPTVNPRREPDGSITFVFRGQPGRRVTIQGDFNNWDPFMSQLAETESGVYRITLRLVPGGHWYRFFVDGNRLLDRYNSETAVDPDGQPVSYFEVSPPPSDPG